MFDRRVSKKDPSPELDIKYLETKPPVHIATHEITQIGQQMQENRNTREAKREKQVANDALHEETRRLLRPEIERHVDSPL
jgi:hypothetical protein